MANKKILEYAKNEKCGKQLWFGTHPQFDMDVADIESCTNYRLPPKFHGMYDTVWLFEKSLDKYHILSWKIILDEATRTLKRKGILIVKIHQCQSITIPMIKHFLGRNINLNVSVDYEYQEKKYHIIVFNIERLNFEIYQNKNWTFAMLTNGTKDDIVIKFLESIRKNEPQKSQIIISGPPKEIYDKYDVEYLDLSKYRDSEYAEISRKKNDIAKMATVANILIAHDRYYLNDKFFTDMDNFGYDFDFLALCQTTENNKDLPYYCATYEPSYIYGQPIDCRNFNILPNTCYVNGGCMVFKTKTLQCVKFNNLLFWNQMEDVEITQEFINKSIVPRVNIISHIIAVDDNSEKMALNYKFDVIKENRIIFNPQRQKDARKHLYGIGKLPIRIKFYLKNKFPFIGFQIRIHMIK